MEGRSLTTGQKTAVVVALMFATLWQILGSPTQVFLLVLGTAASGILGALAYIATRVYFSPLFCPTTPLPPKSALRAQEAAQDIMEAREAAAAEGPLAPYITRSIDQAINDIVDLIGRDYVFRWVDGLMISDAEAKASFKKDFWIMVNNLSARLAKVSCTSQFNKAQQ